MKSKKSEVIKCPNCGAEYHPAEIYVPSAFFGKPTYIERDHLTGVIQDFFGKGMCTEEHYVCDFCNTPFRVNARVQFFTQEEVEFNFNTDYTTSLKKESLFLNED